MKPTANTQIADEIEATAFCLRRLETVRETDCQACFEGHEQLQAGYRHRSRCAEPHWVESAAHDLRFQDAERQHLSQGTELGCMHACGTVKENP